MSDTAIRVDGLSKQYRIVSSGGQKRYKTLQDDLMALPRRVISLARKHNGRLDTFWALQDLSFEVKQGQVLGVIGRNGAGKSTLLKILARITEPTKGHAEISGRVGSLLEVGTGFHPELTGRENIYLSGAIMGMTRREVQGQLDEIVAFADIERFLDSPAKHYSSGMYMRLAFAVAAHLQAEILLIDEVLAVGDAAFQKRCLGKMGEVARAGRTVLFVSHNMHAVEELCGSAMLLEAGTCHAFGNDVRGIIHAYLFGGEATSFAAEWVNAGAEFENPWFKPTRFFLADAAGNPLPMPMENRTAAFLQVEGEVAELDEALTVGYTLYAEDGTLLYWSYQTDTGEAEWPKLHRGRCILRSPIPRRWLNDGVYRIELMGSLHFRRWLFEPGRNAPQVVLAIRGGLSDSPLWMQKRPGLLAPVLPWQLVE
jgi:lipopolysaccharide transport system ATP-binding protein